MKIERLEDAVRLSGLDLGLVALLKQAPACAEPSGNDQAERRIYAPPMENPDPQTLQEWKDFVEPDLRSLFESANETVRRDLEEISGFGLRRYLKIPLKHLDAWLSCLNQARLVLAARHSFSERDLGGDPPLMIRGERELALFQIHFYGFIQELLLQAM